MDQVPDAASPIASSLVVFGSPAENVDALVTVIDQIPADVPARQDQASPTASTSEPSVNDGNGAKEFVKPIGNAPLKEGDSVSVEVSKSGDS